MLTELGTVSTENLSQKEIRDLQEENTSDYRKAALLNIRDSRKSIRKGYRSGRDPLVKTIASSDVDKD